MAIDPHPQRAESRLDNDEDVALLEQIARGDRRAMHDLYRKYYHHLVRFVYRITGQLELAQEAVNDVMLVVWRDAAVFESRSKVSTWIIGIAYRKGLKHAQRARRWRDRFVSADVDESIERFSRAEVPNEHAELEDLLEHALRALPPEQRAVVELTYYFGCSYEEIAKIAGCPVNTVKTRMFHARDKLRKLLPRLGRDELR